MKLPLLFTSLLACLTLNSALAVDLWTEDFAAAKEAAAKEKKDLLLDFTGSDWCSSCAKLREEVFEKAQFTEAAPKSFILVKLDYPQQTPQDEKIKAQNTKLQAFYSVDTFPCIIAADASGRAYARTTYVKGGPVPYLESLYKFRASREARDAAFTKAEKAEGLEKAKAINEGLLALDPDIVTAYYEKEVDSVIALDLEDTLGRKRSREIAKAAKNLESTLQELHGAQKFDEFSVAIDDMITKYKLEGMEKQRLLYNKFSIYGPEKLDQADKLADDIIKIDANSEFGKQALSVKEQIKAIRLKVIEEKTGQ